MKILIVTPFYTPDIGPSAPLFFLLSNALIKRGHKVKVIAAVPHYPSGRVAREFRGKWFRHSKENNVDVIRVAVPSMDRKKFFFRSIQLFAYQVGAALATLGADFDVAFVSNPSLETWLPFFCLRIFRRKPIIFSIHDVYPDVGIRLGIFRTRFVINIITALEKSCLKQATFVRILSESFRPAMNRLGVPDSKISLIYDWVDTDLIHPISKSNDFSREFNLLDKFVVLYAGNIGLSQGLEHVLSAAKLLSQSDDIAFVFVGDGAGLDALKKFTDQMVLSNVLFIPFQPRKRLPQVLASASVSLVILNHGIGNDSLPSKTFSILASGRPILASVDPESEVSKLITRARAGICVSPENPGELARSILDLKNNIPRCEKFGINGREYVMQYHSVNFSVSQFERLFEKMGSLETP